MATDNKNKRLYLAMAWPNGPDKPGERVSVLAKNLDEAKRLLEDTYGKGNIFYLRNPDDAKKTR
jgi:hypothetical protein